jgi:hypothetical protein
MEKRLIEEAFAEIAKSAGDKAKPYKLTFSLGALWMMNKLLEDGRDYKDFEILVNNLDQEFAEMRANFDIDLN